MQHPRLNHAQLEPLQRRLEFHPITTLLVELQAALAELLAMVYLLHKHFGRDGRDEAERRTDASRDRRAMCGLVLDSLRSTVGSLVVLGLVGCRVPSAIETPPPSSAEPAEAPQGETGELDQDEDEDDEYEYEAPDVLPPSPNPAPPEQADTRIGLGHAVDEWPASVSVTTVSVEPDEFRSSLGPHSKSGDQLLACVRSRFADDTAIHGSMVIDYSIGSGARVTAVTVRACEFPDEAICDCIGEVVAKWRFRPNVQLVDVAIRVRAHPRRRPQ